MIWDNIPDKLKLKGEVDYKTFKKAVVFMNLDLNDIRTKVNTSAYNKSVVPNYFLLNLFWTPLKTSYLNVLLQKNHNY